MQKWRSPEYYENNVHKMQLPFSNKLLGSTVTSEEKQERRQQQLRRLQELNARRREEKLQLDQERLERLLYVQVTPCTAGVVVLVWRKWKMRSWGRIILGIVFSVKYLFTEGHFHIISVKEWNMLISCQQITSGLFRNKFGSLFQTAEASDLYQVNKGIFFLMLPFVGTARRWSGGSVSQSFDGT